MPNIVQGANTKGLMIYLVGPGRANEHTNPHIVAASPVIERRWGNWDSLSKAQGEEIAELLDQFMNETGTFPRGKREQYDYDEGRMVSRSAVRNHVFHASLSLGPDEGELSDEQWGKIAKRFMEEMGFDDGLEAPCRWVAVRHGKSKNGGDHIHIAANTVREDGSTWSPWQYKKVSQRACKKLEKEFGLKVVESRYHQRGSRGDSPADMRMSKEAGQRLSDRARLEEIVRAQALAARSEQEFVQRLREAGLRVLPRYAKGGRDKVVGYSVALKGFDRKHPYFGGSRLARDLSLDRLRQRWDGDPDEALNAWAQSNTKPAQKDGKRYGRSDWENARSSLRGFQKRLEEEADFKNPHVLSALSHDMSGSFAASAHAYRGTKLGDQLGDASRTWGRGGQSYRGRKFKTPSALNRAARLLTSHTSDEAAIAIEIVMILLEIALQIACMYEEQKQANTAKDFSYATTPLTYQVSAPSTPYNPWIDKWADERLYVYEMPAKQRGDKPAGKRRVSVKATVGVKRKTWASMTPAQRAAAMGKAAGANFKRSPGKDQRTPTPTPTPPPQQQHDFRRFDDGRKPGPKR